MSVLFAIQCRHPRFEFNFEVTQLCHLTLLKVRHLKPLISNLHFIETSTVQSFTLHLD